MDDTAQKQNQVADSNQSQAQPAVRTPLDNIQPQSQQTVPVPTGSLNKEAEMAPVSDFVKPTETSVIKDKEVAEAGVAEVLQSIELSKEHEQIGVKPSAENTPVKVEDSGNKIQYPLDQTEAEKIVNTNKSTGSSIVWMAILMLKHFKSMHRKLIGRGV
jgi:hypothetical protein